MVVHSIDRVKEDPTQLFVFLLAGGVILVALVVRLIGLGAESAWIDEAFSINLAQHSVSQIIQAQRLTNTPIVLPDSSVLAYAGKVFRMPG
jgi:hypothetical protein